MNKLALLAVACVAASLAACAPDNRNVERKVDELTKKVDQLIARGGAGGAMPQQRQARPEPDVSKVYAMSIEGDPVDGPADAKVTVVKAYPYEALKRYLV